MLKLSETSSIHSQSSTYSSSTTTSSSSSRSKSATQPSRNNTSSFGGLIAAPIKSLQSKLQTMSAQTRIMKELRNMEGAILPGIKLQLTDNLYELYADISVQDNPLYKDETYRLKIMITQDYPFVAPVCMFVRNTDVGINKIPVHPHIYSNGHICLDLLGSGWSPVQTLQSLTISIQSILASNEKNTRPQDDEKYVKRAPKNPAKTKFVYHDDSV